VPAPDFTITEGPHRAYLIGDAVGERNEFDQFIAVDGSAELVSALLAVTDPQMRWAIINLVQAAAASGESKVSAARKRRS
jgi:hypothetical protein